LAYLLYYTETKTWDIIEEDKFRIKTNYTWKDYKTNEDILSELKITPDIQKIQSHIYKRM